MIGRATDKSCFDCIGTSHEEVVSTRTSNTAASAFACVIALASLAFSACAQAAAPSTPSGLDYSVYSDRSAEVFWDRSTDDVLVVGYEITINGQVLGTFDALSYYSQNYVSGVAYDFSVVAVDTDANRSGVASISFVGGNQGINVNENSNQTGTNAPPAAEPVSPASSDEVDDQPTAPAVVDDPVNPTGEQQLSLDPPAPANPFLIVYSRSAAELFWDRHSASFGALQTTVSRDGIVIGQTEGTSFFDNTRSAGQSYRYELVAEDSAGNVSSISVVDETNGQEPAEQPTEEQPTEEQPTEEQPTEEQPTEEQPSEEQPTEEQPVEQPVDPSGSPFVSLDSDLSTDRSVFQRDGYETTNVIRVDLVTATTPGVCNADDESGCTLDDVNADIDKRDDHTVDIAVHFKADDFADDGSVNNAELRLRGGGSRFAPQKSYRIKLDSKEELWREERHLQLNKHPYESSRIRNKLAMELMSRVPHLPSFRTQFVNLWIDDGDGPQDYGFFTHVERPNDRFLEKHGLDKDGNLYKAEDFRFAFSDLQDVRVDEEGEPLDEDRFESSIEIEEGNDHRALVSMLSALHDPERSFESVLDQYFNRNNVLAWVAVNALLHQADSARHNYILYNPSNTEKFYFLPWDYDAAVRRWSLPENDGFSEDDLRRRIEYGYAPLQDNYFVDQYLRMPGIHGTIKQAVSFIRQNYLDDASVDELALSYAALSTPFQERSPDVENNPWNRFPDSNHYSQMLAFNEATLESGFGVPLPPVMSEPTMFEDDWLFSWEPAYEVTGNSVTYDLQIASSPDFDADDIAVEINNISDSNGGVEQIVDHNRLPSGDYFARLIARASHDPARYWVPAANKIDMDGSRYHGTISFSVP